MRIASLCIILIVGLMAGCAHETITEYECNIVLTQSHPYNDSIGAKLVDIASDGTTTIQDTSTGEKLRASPGNFFVSTEYGNEGLQLISASPDRHEAQFIRRWAGRK